MFKKLILKVMLTVSLTCSAIGANAALISQDIISASEGVIGSITINTVPSNNEGLGLQSVQSFESFEFLGFDILTPDPIANEFGDLFYAEYDASDLTTGIQFMQFDVTDIFANILPAWAWAYNGIIDSGFGFVDIFEVESGAFVDFYDDVSLGQASVVSEPAAIALFLVGLMSLRLRRKA